jgi:SulP family sulfate permease
VGTLATLALFAIRLSRVDVIAEEFTARDRRSTMHRSIPDRAILYDRGELLRGYRLRGYIFFGSAHPLIDELKRPLGESPPPSCILLDFAAVSGCDLSAVNLLCQFVQSARRAGVRTVFSEVPPQIEESLRSNLPAEAREQSWFEPDFGSGLERCEELLITLAMRGPSGPKDDERGRLFERVAGRLERHLDEMVAFEELLERLEPWLEPRAYAEGEILSLQGEVRDGLQLLVSGLVSVHDAEGTRLHHCRPGDVLDAWSAFEEKNVASTTAIARTPCRTMMLTRDARERLESDDKDLTLTFFTYIISRQGNVPWFDELDLREVATPSPVLL